ncbi:MAG: hypothetical protein K2L78_00100 [Muribaculaceae bacterium]|nr:hypothetical protein [Muribaculaceae bacterium]
MLLDGMFSVWQQRGYKSSRQKAMGNGAEADLRISRIKQLADGTFAKYLTGRYLSGIIESGEYGTEESIIDSETGKLKYRKEKGDAPMIPFYFMFRIPDNSRYGYLILERIGNIGISTVLTEAMKTEVLLQAGWRYVLNVEPYMIDEVFERNLSLVSDARKVILRGVSNASATLRDITGSLIDDDVRGDMVFSAGRNRSFNIREWLYKLNSRKNRQAPYSFRNLECVDVAFELKIGGKERTISIGKISNLGTNMEITDKVSFGPDGYPTFDSLNNEAQQLLSYIADDDGQK